MLHVKFTRGLALSNIAPSADLRGESGRASPPAEELCENWPGDTNA